MQALTLGGFLPGRGANSTQLSHGTQCLISGFGSDVVRFWYGLMCLVSLSLSLLETNLCFCYCFHGTQCLTSVFLGTDMGPFWYSLMCLVSLSVCELMWVLFGTV